MASKQFNTTAAPFIRQIEEDDREAALRIWDQEFGIENVEGQAEFLDAAIDPDDTYTFGVTAYNLADQEVIGFGLSCRTYPEWANDYLHGLLDFEIPNNAVLMHIGAVRSNWQGRGVGSRLFETRLEWAKQNDAPAAFGVSWLRESHYGSAALFEKYGFERVKTVERYYATELEESSCPDCGYPCECDAALYYLEFDQ